MVIVEETSDIGDTCRRVNPEALLVFASSISVYGRAGGAVELLGPDHPVNPDDIYAESKVEAERLIAASGQPWVNLRISAIAIPEFLDPPDPWPFTPDQRIELVALSDLVQAMVSLVGTREVVNKTVIISGGPSWRTTGAEYVRRWGETMEIPYEDMTFRDSPGWLSWYDSSASEDMLGYQKTSLEEFWAELARAVAEALA